MNARWLTALRILLVGVLSIIALQRNVSGTTFVMMSDDDLAHSSTAIILGEVRFISTVADSIDQVDTQVDIAVEDQLKGTPQSMVTLLVPGGAVGEVRRVVFGTPHFYLGERVVLFLRQRPDGMLAPNALAMGKYTVVPGAAGDVVRRQLKGPGTAVLAYNKSTGELTRGTSTDERPLDAFLETLRQIIGEEPANSERGGLTTPSEAAEGSRVSEAFTFLGTPPSRWVEPDRGRPVVYGVVPTGDAALGADQSMGAVNKAMAAWSNAGSSLRVISSSTPASPAPFNACDGINTIQFNDPFGEIGAPSNCGGILAIGGFCSTSSSTSTVNGVTFLRITEGDLTINDGFRGCGYWNATNLAEVITHEMGHTIGLGHSSENAHESNPTLEDATMFYMAHFDGRGASLRSDDVGGVRALYPAAPRARHCVAGSSCRSRRLPAHTVRPVTGPGH
jgi:hypothetical protein